jgi:hypothetical protein
LRGRLFYIGNNIGNPGGNRIKALRKNNARQWSIDLFPFYGRRIAAKNL